MSPHPDPTMSGQRTDKPEVALYYPGQYWHSPDWIKNMILFFDGVAMLVPSYMEEYWSPDDHSIIEALKDHGLFHRIRPEAVVGKTATEVLANALTNIIESGRIDHLIRKHDQFERESDFGSLSMSRLGYVGDHDLAESIVTELKRRGLAKDSEDGVSIPIHRTVRTLILVLLAQILRGDHTVAGVTLSPITDQARVVNALGEIIPAPKLRSPSVGDVISFDMAMVSTDLGIFPVDEILDFRRQYHAEHRAYCLSARRFARELSLMQPEERDLAFGERQEELDMAAQKLEKIHRKAWRKPVSVAMGLAGAAWMLYQGDPIGAAVVGAGAISERSV